VKAIAIRWAPWLAVAVLVAGIVAFVATRSNGSSPASTPTPPHRAAPLTPAERRLATEFLNTAVARKRLARAWDIVAPELKQGTSLDEWKTGSIPVVPYPVAKATALMRVVNSFTDRARLRVTFVPKTGTAVRPAAFTLDLLNVDGHWLVSGWQPASTVVPPSGK
jgi:hypothetical protein